MYGALMGGVMSGSSGRFVLILVFVSLFLLPSYSSAATYQVSQEPLQWEALDNNRLQPETVNFQFQYGDDESLIYDLPWPILFYGQSYTQITVDTNGNLWFNPADPNNLPINYDLINGGNGPVISVWNSDHNSYYHGGVFIEHKTSPERIVVQWSTGSWNSQGLYRPNYFQVLLTPNNSIQFNYSSINESAAADSGSGVSTGDGSRYYNLTQTLGAVPTLGQTTVSYLHDYDEDGLADVTDPDDDNDGLSDEDELISGSDPYDSNSGSPVPVPEPVPAAGTLALGLTALLLVLFPCYRRSRK